MNTSRRWLPWLVLAAPLALLPFGACSDDPVLPTPADAATDDTGLAPDVADARSEPTPCTPPIVDGGIPDGWVLDETYSDCCGFYVPPTKDLLPAPIEWEACSPQTMGLLPGGAKCRSVKITWNPPVDLNGAGGRGFFDKASGKVIMMSSRVFDKTHVLAFLAEADGPVLAALLETAPYSRCLAGPGGRQSVGGANWALEVSDPISFESKGLLVGRVGESPSATMFFPFSGGQHDITVGQAGVLDADPLDRFWLYDPSSKNPGPTMIASAAQDKLLQTVPNFFEDAIAWVAESSAVMKVRMYHAGQTYDFLDYSKLDVEHGAGALGGDGTDLVWIEGFTHVNAALFQKADYYTSPYTTDPTKLQPRRLRSTSYRMLDSATTIVGCGYAVHSEARSLRILRIADGVSWLIPSTAPNVNPPDTVEWQAAFAVTCSEVFVRTERLPVRIDIASLGPGIPPD